MTAQQAPQPLTVPELLEVLAALGAPATVPADLDDADAVLHLSHGLVGAAERKAMEAELREWEKPWLRHEVATTVFPTLRSSRSMRAGR